LALDAPLCITSGIGVAETPSDKLKHGRDDWGGLGSYGPRSADAGLLSMMRPCSPVSILHANLHTRPSFL
jgi:hypothetical protein